MKIRKIFLGIGLSLAMVFSSCENIIDIEPEFVRDGAIPLKNLDEFQFALTGAYAKFRAVGYFGSGGQTTGTWSILPDIMSDNLVQTNEDLGNWAAQADFTYASDESDLAIAWVTAYSIINQVNLILRDIDQFSAENPERVNRIKGQALAIRGMVHFDLLRYWGVEFDRNSTKLGIPYKTSVNKDELPARLTVKETYDNIFKDLNEAEALLGNVDKNINSVTNRAFIDQLATRAILARVSLYAKEYTKAIEYATLVINDKPLASKTEFPAIWKDASQAEVIWAVSFNAGEGSPASGVFNASSNRNRFRPSTNLMAAYAQKDETKPDDSQSVDVRFPAYFSKRARFGTIRTIVNKFVGRGTASDDIVNWKAFRTGEMYLIRAEAKALSGDEAGALADLNTLRAARITFYSPVALSGQALLNAIALERRKELFAEGHRWFDLKRTTRMLTRDDCGTTATTCSLAPNAREWIWPIPQGELDANINIRDQQNPGY